MVIPNTFLRYYTALKVALWRMTKRVAAVELFGSEQLTITPLGAGCEVGRSCIIIRFKGKTIMLDCGIHPAYTGLAGLPFFDEIEPESIDMVLISQY